MKSILKSPFKNFFLLGLLVFITTAFFSEGYHNPDEHFQVLEFCNYKLGNSPAADLPWEFEGGNRQTIQPALAYVIIKCLNFISIQNPFTEAIILRILAALLSWFLVCKLCILLVKDFKTVTGKLIFVFLSFFLWFIPYISVRFSGENFSGILFMAAVYHILCALENRKYLTVKTICAGLLFGLSFYFRFQTAFAIIGVGCWLLFIKKQGWPFIATLVVSAIVALGFCFGVDSWFYGRLEFTPYNYFYKQIVENISSNWGVFPWWYYFQLVFLMAVPPVSIGLILLFLFGTYKKPSSIFVWAIIPYLIVHFLVGYKEIRYLFPMEFGFIYLISFGADDLLQKGVNGKLLRLIYFLFLVINTPILVFRMLIPAQEAVKYYKFLYNYSKDKETILLCKEKSIYELVGYEMNFYKSPRVQCIILPDDSSISNYIREKKPDSILLLERNLKTNSQFNGYTKETAYCLFPDWVLKYNINDWESRARIWNIVKLTLHK